MSSDHSAGSANLCSGRDCLCSIALGAEGTSGMVLGIASGGISKAGPCIVPTAVLGTCSRLSANPTAENPNSVLYFLLTHSFRAVAASFDPDLPSHLFFQDIPDDSVSFRSQQRAELVGSSQP